VPFAALPRWQACQRVLVTLQGDKMSADATRVLRVIGTVNSKTKSVVKAEMLNPQRYDFDWLCDQILPVERAKLRDLRAERARRGGELASAPRRIVGTIYDRWYLVYRDLCQICDYHWFGGVEAGQRDTMLHLMATSLSWFTQGDALEAEIQQTARRFMPSLTPQEVRSYTGSVLTRARHDADNEVGPAEWEWGKSRYRYKRETIYNLLESWIAPHPDLAEKLRAIVTDEVIRERKTEREKARNTPQASASRRARHTWPRRKNGAHRPGAARRGSVRAQDRRASGRLGEHRVELLEGRAGAKNRGVRGWCP
jgi:hypothetical protein